MSERPTPETDKKLNLFPWIDFARIATDEMIQSKRKLREAREDADEAIAECKALWSLVNANKLKAYKAERERDEAREHLREIKEYGTEEINAAVELRQKLATALVERDDYVERCRIALSERDSWRMQAERNEAREENAKLREIADALGGALERLDALYRSEQDPEAPMPRPDWLRRPLQMLDAELNQLKEGAK
jgi:hypothetical protein